MPIYEYVCKKCSHQVEILIRTDADVPKKCPSCGSRSIDKAFSAFAVGAANSGLPAAQCTECPSQSSACASSGGCPFSG